MCLDDEECLGGVCEYGACLGVLTASRRWQEASIMVRLEDLVSTAPTQRVSLLTELSRVISSNQVDLLLRARAIRALEAVGAGDELVALRRALDPADTAVEVSIALSMCRLGMREGLPLAAALTESDNESLAMEAARALGASGMSDALVPLLRLLNPALSRNLLSVAIEGLGELGDTRAAHGLVTFLGACPEYLSFEVVTALRKVSGQQLGFDRAVWRDWLLQSAISRPPVYELLAFEPGRELGLPTP